MLQSNQKPVGLYINGVTCGATEPQKRGTVSDIYLGRLDGKVVALKQLRPGSEEDFTKDLNRKAPVWQQLDHPFLLPFLGIDIETSRRPRLVYPWMANGNIIEAAKRMKKNNEDLSTLLPTWIREVATAIDFLHEHHIVHGDVRGANIFLDEDCRVQVTDVEISMIINTATVLFIESRPTPFQWRPPELVFDEVASPTAECDVYSFGCFASSSTP